MKIRPTNDEIHQMVREFESGLLQNTFADSSCFCEELFNRPMIQNIPVGFSYYDDQFVLQKCNRTYGDYVRMYTPFNVERALGMSHFDYKPGAAPYMEDWFVAVRNSRMADTRYSLELRVEVDKGECVSFWDSHLEPVTDFGGELRGFLMCCIDRTDKNLMDQSGGILRRNQELNTTLRILMRAQEEERRLVASKLAYNVKIQIAPLVKRLKNGRLSSQQLTIIEAIEKQIDAIVSPFSLKLSSKHFGLTPTEVRVAGLIRDGLTSKEIAEMLNVSKECVDFHRNNVRRKLGIRGKRINMRTYLSNIAAGD